MPRIFVAQVLVDQWLGEGRAQLDGELMQVDTGSVSTSLFIDPAVYFECVDGSGSEDPYQVVGCVKSAQELVQMGGEHFDTSVVLGEQAYTVVPGFIAVCVEPDGTESPMDGQRWGQLRGALAQLAGE